MAHWTLLTCACEGDPFIESTSLDWPVPLTGEVFLDLKKGAQNPAAAVEFELQTDFSGNFSAFSSDGRFSLAFLHSPDQDGKRILTGAVTRHRADGEDVHAFTAITSE